MDKHGFTPLERKFCPLGEHRKTFSLLRGGVKKYIARPIRKNISNGSRWGFRLWRIRLGRKSSHPSFLTGFTLIELLIVIAIIGILGGIAVTAYIGTTRKAARSEAYSNLESLRLLEEQFFAENATYTGILANLPGFQPGPNPSFAYALNPNVALTLPVAVPYVVGAGAVAQDPCFVATAIGIAGTRVAADVFAIDCNNNRNF